MNLFNVAKWKPEIIDLFNQIGFFDLLGIQRPKRPASTSTLTVVPFKTGSTFGNEEAGELMKTLAEMLVGADPAGILDANIRPARLQLYSALVEACENTRKHAYPESITSTRRTTVSRWWMTGSFDEHEKRMSLVVYDQGVTIPGSLPYWDKFDAVRRGFRRLMKMAPPAPDDPSRDGMLLHMAMAVPRSSTGLPWRGKGFPAFKEVINASANGRLRIISRCGEFILEKGKRPHAQQLRTPLDGTLVEWDLWL